eukprot:1286424-Prymnesium_polylepis.1
MPPRWRRPSEGAQLRPMHPPGRPQAPAMHPPRRAQAVAAPAAFGVRPDGAGALGESSDRSSELLTVYTAGRAERRTWPCSLLCTQSWFVMHCFAHNHGYRWIVCGCPDLGTCLRVRPGMTRRKGATAPGVSPWRPAPCGGHGPRERRGFSPRFHNVANPVASGTIV